MALTHSLARRSDLSPFFFSEYNFKRMQERKNTHYCFDCGGDVGFTPGPDGKPTNTVIREYNAMKSHGADHEFSVVANADKYTNPQDWLSHEIRTGFPYLVSIV